MCLSNDFLYTDCTWQMPITLNMAPIGTENINSKPEPQKSRVKSQEFDIANVSKQQTNQLNKE